VPWWIYSNAATTPGSSWSPTPADRVNAATLTPCTIPSRDRRHAMPYMGGILWRWTRHSQTRNCPNSKG
jgi:hypothetical protein